MTPAGAEDVMFRLVGVESSDQEIKKSRFRAIAAPVADEAAAKAFVASYSDPLASHNCFAWRIGQAYRFHDAGEPSGTAGKPILAAIDGQALDHVAVLVIRWFGGILLGSGGLIRAYGGGICRGDRGVDAVRVFRSGAGQGASCRSTRPADCWRDVRRRRGKPVAGLSANGCRGGGAHGQRYHQRSLDIALCNVMQPKLNSDIADAFFPYPARCRVMNGRFQAILVHDPWRAPASPPDVDTAP